MKTVAYHTSTNDNSYQDMTHPAPDAWQWVKKNESGDIHIIEENTLLQHEQFKGDKIAVILETPAVYNYCKINNKNIFDPFEWIKLNHQHFKFIMSPFKFLKDIVGEEKYLYVPVGGSRIKEDDFGMYEKERLLSIVASHKAWTEGHKLRHEIVKKFPGKIETYGSGYNNIINETNGKMGKIIAIAPYYFTLSIMNSTYDDYFTEVITDAFAVGTIPIWWGTNKIGNYFNADGIISFRTVDDLEKILPTLTPDLYKSKQKAVVENIELSKQYISHFNWIYKNYKQKFESL